MRSVWIVEEGESHEGGQVLAVARSPEVAQRIATARFEEWHWEDKRQIGPIYWTGGCDWIQVTEYDITEE